jgi:hypothetical protein
MCTSSKLKALRRKLKENGRVKNMIKYYLFCIHWLWKNRKWYSTRQNFKMMDWEWQERDETKKRRN